MRSDNGAPFASDQGVLGLSRLSAWWVVLGIDLERGRPGCPQDNGGHERLHLDVERELRGQDLEGQQAGFDEWRKTFNQERPHEALGMKCPGSRFNTWVTQMVQDMGNTWRAVLGKLFDAVETIRAHEPKNRVCIESDESG
jgi:transposase InsO family protein